MRPSKPRLRSMKSSSQGLHLQDTPPPLSRPSVFRLTLREKAVASHLGDDVEPAEIGEALGIKANTVRVYVRSIYQKLGVRSRHAAVTRLIQKGFPVSQELTQRH